MTCERPTVRFPSNIDFDLLSFYRLLRCLVHYLCVYVFLSVGLPIVFLRLCMLFTALHGMQTRSSDDNSVCQTREL